MISRLPLIILTFASCSTKHKTSEKCKKIEAALIQDIQDYDLALYKQKNGEQDPSFFAVKDGKKSYLIEDRNFTENCNSWGFWFNITYHFYVCGEERDQFAQNLKTGEYEEICDLPLYRE